MEAGSLIQFLTIQPSSSNAPSTPFDATGRLSEILENDDSNNRLSFMGIVGQYLSGHTDTSAEKDSLTAWAGNLEKIGQEAIQPLAENPDPTVLPDVMKEDSVVADVDDVEMGVALLSAFERNTSQEMSRINIPETTPLTSIKETAFGDASEETLPEELYTTQQTIRSKTLQPEASQASVAGDQPIQDISEDFANHFFSGRAEKKTKVKNEINLEVTSDDNGSDGQNQLRPSVTPPAIDKDVYSQGVTGLIDQGGGEKQTALGQSAEPSTAETDSNQHIRFAPMDRGGRDNQSGLRQVVIPSTVETSPKQPDPSGLTGPGEQDRQDGRSIVTEQGRQASQADIRQSFTSPAVIKGVASPVLFDATGAGGENQSATGQSAETSTVETDSNQHVRFVSMVPGERDNQSGLRQAVIPSTVETSRTQPDPSGLNGPGEWDSQEGRSGVIEQGRGESQADTRQTFTWQTMTKRDGSRVLFDATGAGGENQSATGQSEETSTAEKASDQHVRFASMDRGGRENQTTIDPSVEPSTATEMPGRDFRFASIHQQERQDAPYSPYDGEEIAIPEDWVENQGAVSSSPSQGEKNVKQQGKSDAMPLGIDKAARNSTTATSDLDRQTKEQHAEEDGTGTKESRFQFAKLASPSARVDIDKPGAEDGIKTDLTDYHFAKSSSIVFDSVPSTTAQTTSSNGSPQPVMDNDFQKMVMDQVVDKAVIRSTDEGSEIRIQLKPDALGDVRMRITSENNQLAVKMVVDQVNTKEILESQLHHLKAELSRQGLIVDHIEVLVNTNTEQNQSREQFFQMNYNGGGRRGAGEERQRQRQQQHAQGGGSNPEQSAGKDGINYFA